MSSLTFDDLGLPGPLLEAVKREGYETPTEVQARAIPIMLGRRDLLATAQTGTGKTAAFVLPLLHLLSAESRDRDAEVVRTEAGPDRRGSHGRSNRRSFRSDSMRQAVPEALILAPTRELAVQIDERVAAYGSLLSVGHTAVYGGAPKPTQKERLSRRPRLLVATPGRLLDFINEGAISLSAVRYLVLDEADRMLDMGFIPDVRRISAMIAEKHQTALFSATMPREIEDLAASVLSSPERVEGEQGRMRIERIKQSVMFVEQGNKMQLLIDLITQQQMFRAIVFTRTKHRASRVAKALSKEHISSDAIHGDKTQSARRRALGDFRSGRIQVLVATDVASRGIDVDDITHVVNFEIPREPETYVHRVGRTARAGAHGSAVSLCDREEVGAFRAIERLLDESMEVNRDHPYHVDLPARRPQTAQRGVRPTARAGSGAGGRGSSPRTGGSPDSRKTSRGSSYFAETFGDGGGTSRGKGAAGRTGRRKKR